MQITDSISAHSPAPIIQMSVSLAIILYTKVARATIQKTVPCQQHIYVEYLPILRLFNSRLHTFYTIRKNAEKNIAIIAENMLERKNRQPYPVCSLKH